MHGVRPSAKIRRMSNISSMTYARIGAILHEIGMVSEAQMHRTLAEAANYAYEPLEEHFEAACALEEFGVAISVHATTSTPSTTTTPPCWKTP